jgi:hypothetical protein
VLQVLRLVELDVDADVIWEAPGEELCLLQWGEGARVRRAGLECLHVLVDRGCERQPCQIGQVIGTEGRPEPLLA